jgi:CPA1 family monovalent cation:H+ antiporter
MFEFEAIIVFITLIVLFSYLADTINIPYPIILMLLGLSLGYFHFAPRLSNFTISREILLPLFLPPILFWGAMLTNWHQFRRHWLLISSLGILLVLATSFLVAVVVNQFFPGLGFIPALLLGAIISPSDAVCATAVLSRLGLSSRLISILEGESLINDASGIVLYNIALSTLLYHTSDFNHPVWGFFVVAIGGIVTGAIIGLIFGFIFHHLSHNVANKRDASLPIIVSLVIPYFVYYAGEKLGVSSVLAVVASGMFMRLLGDYKMEAQSRLRGVPVWDTLIFILNGLIFIMLGLEFPKVIARATSIIPLSSLVELTVIVLLSIVLVRVAWVYASAKLLRSAESWKENLLIAWSGMRGIVSLALALSIPTVSQDISTHGDLILLVTREVILFVTVMTILFTVIIQGLSLPWLVKYLKLDKKDKTSHAEIMQVFEHLTQETIDKIEQTDMGDADYLKEAKAYLLNHYQNRLQYQQIRSSLRAERDTQKKQKLQQVIFQYYRYERKQLRHLYRDGKIDMEIFSRLMHYLDMEEAKHLYQ